jgi:hypothetical protein
MPSNLQNSIGRPQIVLRIVEIEADPVSMPVEVLTDFLGIFEAWSKLFSEPV